jgi:bifunctional non-homologous end joining protein LigD
MNRFEPPVLAPMAAGGHGWPSDLSRYQLEPKFDGQRIVARVVGGGVELRSRNAKDTTTVYPELRVPPGPVVDRSAVLDGEVVAFDPQGRIDFQLLQSRMHVRQPSARLQADVPVVFVVFDVLWLDGTSLIERRQDDRRDVLEGLGLSSTSWQQAPLLRGQPEDLLAGCVAVGLEGIMAKRVDAPYRPGQRSASWVKIKVRRQREFVVGGWCPGEGSRAATIGSLAVGYVDPGADLLDGPALRYVGQVGSGLSGVLISELHTAFDRFAQAESPFLDIPTYLDIHFVAPLLVVQVAFAELTRAGTLRAPTLKGLRTDVAAADVGWDAELADHRPGA